MSIGKLLALVLGLAAVAFTVKIALAPTEGDGVTAPARQLDSVRNRTREIERDLQKNADRADLQRER